MLAKGQVILNHEPLLVEQVEHFGTSFPVIATGFDPRTGQSPGTLAGTGASKSLSPTS